MSTYTKPELVFIQDSNPPSIHLSNEYPQKNVSFSNESTTYYYEPEATLYQPAGEETTFITKPTKCERIYYIFPIMTLCLCLFVIALFLFLLFSQ